MGLIEKDMALNEAEFKRSLGIAMEGRAFSIQGRKVLAEGIEIGFENLPPRTIALLNIPRMKITLNLAGLSQADQTEFLERFDRCFQRGGG